MNDAVIPILTKLLQQYGNSLCTDTRRLKALLSDLAIGCKREINVLIQAADCRIGQELAQQANAKLDVFAYNNLVRRLIDETSITNEAAEWAVRAWATALNKQLRSNVPPELPSQKADAAAIPKTAAATDVRVTSERKRLLDIMLDPQYPPQVRAEAGREINKVGDPRPGVGLRPDGLPDIVWCEVPGGEFSMGSDSESDNPVRKVIVPTFYITKYLVTYVQFKAFLDAKDGSSNTAWAKGFHADGLAQRKQGVREQNWPIANHPRENVSWYDAVAFSRWLSVKFGYEIVLPIERQWEKAARGTDIRKYPWGSEYQIGFANINEISPSKIGLYDLQRTTAVGVYPQGASPYGVLDLAGNVLEWTLTACGSFLTTAYESRDSQSVSSNEARTVRGGSWDTQDGARTTYRINYDPDVRNAGLGFRLVTMGHFPPLSSAPLLSRTSLRSRFSHLVGG